MSASVQEAIQQFVGQNGPIYVQHYRMPSKYLPGNPNRQWFIHSVYPRQSTLQGIVFPVGQAGCFVLADDLPTLTRQLS